MREEVNARHDGAELQHDARYVLEHSVVHLSRDTRSLIQYCFVVCLVTLRSSFCVSVDSLSDYCRDLSSMVSSVSDPIGMRVNTL